MKRLNYGSAAVVLGILAGCGSDAPSANESIGQSEQSVLSDGEHTKLLRLRVDVEGVEQYDPVIVSMNRRNEPSAVIRLDCGATECTQLLNAFGYTNHFVRIAPSYDDLELLLHSNTIPSETPFIKLSSTTVDPFQVIGAFRVVDADPSKDDQYPYLVRLAADPDKLYATSCTNFLEYFQGNSNTVPINQAVVEGWKTNGFEHFPELSCNATTGKALPAMAAPEKVTHPPRLSQDVRVWFVNYMFDGVTSTAVPYLVTKEGDETRGYPFDCGAEVGGALKALGFEPSDIEDHDIDEEFFATHPGEQPVLRCLKQSDTKDPKAITAYRPSNETPAGTYFQMGSASKLVEFTCPTANDYWSSRAAQTLDVPRQALPYVAISTANTNPLDPQQLAQVVQIGCRVNVDWHPWFNDAFGRPNSEAEEQKYTSVTMSCRGDEACVRNAMDVDVRALEKQSTIGRAVIAGKIQKGAMEGGTVFAEDVDYFVQKVASTSTASTGFYRWVRNRVAAASVMTRSEIQRAYHDVDGCGRSKYSPNVCIDDATIRKLIFRMYDNYTERFDYVRLAREREAYYKNCLKNDTGTCARDLDGLICRSLTNVNSPWWNKADACTKWWTDTFRSVLRGKSTISAQHDVWAAKSRPDFGHLSCIADAWPPASTRKTLPVSSLQHCVTKTFAWD